MNPGDPGVLLNDVLAQADRDTLDDYATDQAETSCAANPSAPPLPISPPFSTPPTRNSSTQSLRIHLRDCRTHSGNSTHLERRQAGRDFGQIR